MPYIPTEPVESSNIDEIGYDRKKRILRIVFHGGRVYDYPDVMERVYKELMEADSKGQHFNRRIKPVYTYRSVTRPQELKAPCCDHPERDTCDETCWPCDEWCCPGPPDTGAAIPFCPDCDTQCEACIAALTCPHGEGGRDCEEGCACHCHTLEDAEPVKKPEEAAPTTETTILPPEELSMMGLLGWAEIMVSQALQEHSLDALVEISDKLAELRVLCENFGRSLCGDCGDAAGQAPLEEISSHESSPGVDHALTTHVPDPYVEDCVGQPPSEEDPETEEEDNGSEA